MFDRSPLGLNSLLAHRFRRMLAPLIFRSVGENFKCWQFVEWSFGYNLSFGNNVVVHRHVLLDDRGGIDIGDDVSISDYVNIYSHNHDIYDIHKVNTLRTRIGNGVRITYHATVLAGTQIGDHAMIGTGAVVTRDVEPHHVVVGLPAKTGERMHVDSQVLLVRLERHCGRVCSAVLAKDDFPHAAACITTYNAVRLPIRQGDTLADLPEAGLQSMPGGLC